MNRPSDDRTSLTLILGGVRAGKSLRALELATQYSKRLNQGTVLFVATAQALDNEMQQRIAAHRAERPVHWQTIEEPIDIVEALEQQLNQGTAGASIVVLDCLTLWVSNLLLSVGEGQDVDAAVTKRVRELVALMSRHITASTPTGSIRRRWIVVSNEVGLGIVPPTALGRQYRDLLGRANQLIAQAASHVTLMVAGLEMTLKQQAPPNTSIDDTAEPMLS